MLQQQRGGRARGRRRARGGSPRRRPGCRRRRRPRRARRASGIRERSGMPPACTHGWSVEPGQRVAAHRARVLGGEDDPAPARPARTPARRPAIGGPSPRRWTSSSTANSESPQTPSRTSASATPRDRPVVLGHPGAAGVGRAQVLDPGQAAGAALGLRLAGHRVEQHPQAEVVDAPPRRPRASAGSRSGSPRAPVKQAAMGYPLGSHGRPEAEAVAQPHDQAPRAAQDRARRRSTRARSATARGAPPRLPDVRHLRRPRGRARRTRTTTTTSTDA